MALRIPVELVLGSPGAHQLAYVMDLSESGVFVMMSEVHEVGHVVALSFRVPPDVFCEATGRVVRAMPFGSGQGLALEVTACSDAWRNYIRNLLEADEVSRGEILSDVRAFCIHIT